MTKDEAVRRFVRDMNCIKQDTLQRAYPFPELMDDITPLSVGDMVILPDGTEGELEAKVSDFGVVDGEKYPLSEMCRRDDGYPMWGWMWTPDPIDEGWIRDNLETVASCGFVIMEDCDGDIYLGIDGAGYDFYEAHWEPLYDARGLQFE